MFSGKEKTGKRISAEGDYVKSKKQQHIEGVGTVNLEVLGTSFFVMFDPLVSNESAVLASTKETKTVCSCASAAHIN